jgi:hypothetical protein
MILQFTNRQLVSVLGRHVRMTPKTSRQFSALTMTAMKSISSTTTSTTTSSSHSSRYFSSALPDEANDLAFQTDPSVLKLKFKERLAEERKAALMGGGQKRIDKQHQKGSLTARERLELLFDEGTFHELDQLKAHRCHEFDMDDKNFPGDGVVTGYGKVNGRFVYAFSQGTLSVVDFL